jgi:hypothetical protein
MWQLVRRDEVERHFAQAFQFLLDENRTVAESGVELSVQGLGHEAVLTGRNGALEHAVDGDHIDADQLLGVADPLRRHLTKVRNELDAQPSDLAARVATADAA